MRNGQYVSLITGQAVQNIALAIVAVGFGLRLYALASESLWYDELLQLDIAQGPVAMIFPRLRGHSGVPLDYLIGHFWILLGRSDGWVRLPAVIAGTLVLPIAYQLGRWLLGRDLGLLFMLILAFSPFHVNYSQEVRPYALVVLGVTLTGYAFWRLRETGQWRYFVLLQIGVLIFSLAHIFAAVIFILLNFFFVVDFIFRRDRKWLLQPFGALLLAGLAPLLVFLLMGWGDVLFYTSKGFGEALVRPEKLTLDVSQAPKPITGPEVNWPFIRDKILAPFAAGDSLIILLFFNGLAALGLVYLLAQKKFKLSLLLFLWVILPPLVIVSLLVFRDTFFASRYIISILPAYLILLSAGILAVPRWLKRVGLEWFSGGLLVIVSGLVLANQIVGLGRHYQEKNKENWHLVSNFIATNAGPNDTIVAFHAEPTMNWYYPRARAAPNYFEDLESIKAAVAQAERSWVILSIFSSGSDARVKAWLSEQQAIRFVLDPIIHVYYLGNDVPPDQLLAEVQEFALPVDHALYASLARENRRRPDVARRYYQLAIEHAPDDETRAEYQAALKALRMGE